MTVLFEDAHIIVCLKPAGILSQGDDKGRENMISILGGNVFPVHRLDRETAGIMVFAKTAESAAAMSILVQSHENFRKEYLAVLEGVLTKREDVFEDLLYHLLFEISHQSWICHLF